MQALGMIETMGLLGAIEGADSALKAANVTIVNKHYAKGGIVTIEVNGDVGAVKAAIEAAEETTKRLGVYLTSHVIPRPHSEVAELIKVKEAIPIKLKEKKAETVEEKKTTKTSNKSN